MKDMGAVRKLVQVSVRATDVKRKASPPQHIHPDGAVLRTSYRRVRT